MAGRQSEPDKAPALIIGELEILEIRGVALSGLTVESVVSGSMGFSIERLTAQQLLARSADATLMIADAVLTRVRGLSTPVANGSPKPKALHVEEMTAQRIEVVIPTSVDQVLVDSADLKLSALRELDGVVSAFVDDALWWIDVEVVVPVSHGKVDLHRVDLNHMGPDASLKVGPAELEVIAPHGQSITLLTFDNSRLDLRGGVLDVPALVREALHPQPGRPLASAGERLQTALRGMRLKGEVRLGDGALGDARRHLLLQGRDGGANRIEITSPAIGQEVRLRMARFAAGELTWALSGGSISASSLTAEVGARIVPGTHPTARGSGAVVELTMSAVTCKAVAWDELATLRTSAE